MQILIRTLYCFLLVVILLPQGLRAQEALAWQPKLQTTSYGTKEATVVFLGWTLSDGVANDPEQVEDLGFEVTRRDVGSLVTVNPGEEGYGDGTAGGWIEDESVVAHQTYTYDVRIFDRDGRSSNASISVRAEPDVIYDPEEDCTKSPSMTSTVDGLSVTLDWTAMCGAQEYIIWRELAQEEEQGPFGAKPSLTTIATGLPATTLTYTDTVQSAGEYVYTVIGYQILSGTPDEGLPPTDNGSGDVDIPGLPPAARLFGVGTALAQNTGGGSPSGPAGTTTTGKASTKATVQGPPPPAAGAGSGAGGANPSLCSDKLIDPTKGIAQNLECLYDRSLTILLWLVILMLIISGYVYITAVGNQDRTKLAKEILGTTLIGVALYLLLPLILQALGA